MKVLIDTCVLIDMVDKNQTRATLGKQLYDFLTSKNIEVTLLRHSFFEMASVLKNLKINNKPYNFENDFYLKINCVVDIDEKFVETYLDVNLPYSKGADWIYLCFASKEKIDFITEDIALYKKCKEAGIGVFNIKEYIDNHK